MGKKQGEVSKDETKQERFVRVVTPRVKKAIKAIRVIGYCSSTAYVFSEVEVQVIITALTTEIALLEKRFSEKSQRAEIEFKL